MKGQVALIREQGQEFSILLVKDQVVAHPRQREEVLAFAVREFGVRSALLGERTLSTYGPEDIVDWLSGIYVEQLPWRDFWMDS